MLSVDELAQMIDHSILLPQQTEKDLEEGVALARQYRVKCVVPKIFQLPRTRELLQGSGVRKSGIGGADGKHGLYECTQTHVVSIQN